MDGKKLGHLEILKSMRLEEILKTVQVSRGRSFRARRNGRRARVTPITEMEITTTTNEETITIDRGLTRSGIQFQVNESIDTQSFGDKLVNSELIPFMRSRNIEFVATRIQPRTQFYTFFDGQEVNRYVTPKLIEISMNQGVFEVGETVSGLSDDWQTGSTGNVAAN